jgi:uncharacterized protein YgbK (DUF1537 family)
VPEFIIIADDLSGACDTAVQFKNAGYKTMVLNNPASFLSLDSQYSAIALTTNSRDVTPDEAREKVEEACRYLKTLPNTNIYKKMDSTWRGNIGAELEVLMENLGYKFALICSAYPQNNRIGLGGYLLVDGQLLQYSPIAKDPASPIRQGYLPHILQRQTSLPVVYINLQIIEGGLQELRNFILGKLEEEGPCLFIADGVLDSHLDTLALLTNTNLPPHIYVGSAGLSSALLRQKKDTLPPEKSLPVLTFIGSVHPRSNLQVEEMINKTGVKDITLSAEYLLDPALEQLKDLIQRMVTILNRGEDLVIRTSRSTEDVEKLKDRGVKLGLNGAEISNQVALVIQKLLSRILVQVKIAGIMITGGATALELVEGTGAQGIEVIKEIEPGVPLGKIVGGIVDGLPIITKAGGFGSLDIFCKGREYLVKGENLNG